VSRRHAGTRPWRPYDPTWLVALAKVQTPELAEALARCTQAQEECPAYFLFVDPATWSFDRNVILDDRREGELVLDVMTDDRVGGVEFRSKL
jgi:hypothetical protein